MPAVTRAADINDDETLAEQRSADTPSQHPWPGGPAGQVSCFFVEPVRLGPKIVKWFDEIRASLEVIHSGC